MYIDMSTHAVEAPQENSYHIEMMPTLNEDHYPNHEKYGEHYCKSFKYSGNNNIMIIALRP